MSKVIEGKVLKIYDAFADVISIGEHQSECGVLVQTEFETLTQKIIRKLSWNDGSTREFVVVDTPRFREGQTVKLEVEKVQVGDQWYYKAVKDFNLNPGEEQ